jgi:hypothetical protein
VDGRFFEKELWNFTETNGIENQKKPVEGIY